MMIKKIFCFILTFLLIGCTGLESDFSCKATTNGSCMTMSEANNLGKQKTSNVKLISSQDVKTSEKNQSMSSASVMGVPDRTTEKVYKIWIAPYVDDKDNFHREQNIFFTTGPTQWKGFE